MQEVLSIFEKVIPDAMQALKERHQILRQIYLLAPVGRRVLADKLNMTERSLRTEVEVLKKQQLIVSSKSGMQLTSMGKDVFRSLDTFMGQLLGIREKEKRLAQHLQIDQCVIVSGDVDEQDKVKEEMGRVVLETLNFLLPPGLSVVAVMGGTTMAAVAGQFNTTLSHNREFIFVPARGGIGESVEIQANSISAQMAKATGGKSQVLYVPEQVGKGTYEMLLQEPSVSKALDLINSANCVLYGIGEAIPMAKRRGMDQETLQLLKEKAAVGEAFGEFYDANGKVIYKIPRIGLQFKQLAQIPNVIAIAGGAKKAEAIEVNMKKAPSQSWLITDEGAANLILRG
ncbi:sugar-binding transcriptional regulator [Pisciglobus halotolerans]|uniref:Central glycolytic genes regulator n=1 Tax=Pisciglobus halotolerans TaxID=745365 RepID=A0A1I3C1J8_9LACT|nr:sugar-binding domain-containing protein [Pisciglobus halotolerans]SFH68424.1 central glycolytic genes regulator [Pisciglobus halotolerans]